MENILKHLQEKKHPITIIAAMLILVGGLYAWNTSAPQDAVVVTDENQAAQVSYTPLAPLPGQDAVGTANVVGYLKNMLNLGIGLAIVLAVLMIVIGGIRYMASDAFTDKKEATTQMTMAVFGLIIALGGYLLLQIINPDLVMFKLPGKIDIKTPIQQVPGNKTTAPTSPTITEVKKNICYEDITDGRQTTYKITRVFGSEKECTSRCVGKNKFCSDQGSIVKRDPTVKITPDPDVNEYKCFCAGAPCYQFEDDAVKRKLEKAWFDASCR
ncbi:MAG: hypothetical protein HYT27_03805 [Parcubacteria group bacterium]|nr:hypothetical protein [Parcubacteria group bacterium]